MIKAIQTAYKGYHFRSRLEARWAVFFDALGMKWEYEPEGFELPGGVRYLPDFKVTNADGGIIWYEVKPESCAFDPKFAVFHQHLSHQVFDGSTSQMLIGDPVHLVGLSDGAVCPCCGALEQGRAVEWPSGPWGDAHLYCFNCDSGPSRGRLFGINSVPVDNHKGYTTCENRNWARHVANVNRAAIAARSARFEHGQSGATL